MTILEHEGEQTPSLWYRSFHGRHRYPLALGMLALEGQIVSIDAMGSQTTIAQANVEKKADYISSLKSSAAEQQHNIRHHWSIENSCHSVLDTAFREDYNQTYVGNAAKNRSIVRRIVMNMLQIDKTYPKSTPKKRMRALMDKKSREHLLSLA